jgi:hypothetical protein
LIFLFIIKEGFQLAAMLIFYMKGKMLKGALLSGKISTTILFISLIIMVLFHDVITQNVVHLLTGIDSFFMMIAFIHYVITYLKQTPMIQDVTDA